MAEPLNYRDARRIVLARGLRQFAYGELAVVLAIALSQGGFTPVAIGALVTVSLLGDFCGTLLIGRFADGWGRRRTLVVLALVMAITGLIFGLSSFYPLLLIAAFVGTLGTTASETAPFLPLEQAMLPQVLPATDRTAWFAKYNLVASLAAAAGGLAAALPAALERLGVGATQSLRVSFGLYALLALVVAVLAWRLSPSVEALPAKRMAPRVGGIAELRDTSSTHWWRRLLPPLPHSRGMVLKLTALFSVDALAGGLVGQTLLALFFHLRFGVPLGVLGILFFSTNLVSALSFLAAAPLAQRFGLLNTMVFTHLPSNVFLFLVALMPTFPLAAVMLLLRQLLSQMDIPTRQAYTMALVAPEERTAAASVTSLARSAGAATSPVFAGLFLQGSLLVLGLPFLLAGTIKAGYDLTLWRLFRPVPLTAGEEASSTSPASVKGLH
jgi:MFS family permease